MQIVNLEGREVKSTNYLRQADAAEYLGMNPKTFTQHVWLEKQRGNVLEPEGRVLTGKPGYPPPVYSKKALRNWKAQKAVASKS